MLKSTTCLSDTLINMKRLMVEISSKWGHGMSQDASNLAKLNGRGILKTVSGFRLEYFTEEEAQHIKNFETMMLILTNEIIDFGDYD